MSAQALRCAKTASAEAALRCALLWSSENAAGAKRDQKLQVLGARRVPKRHLSGGVIALALSTGRHPRPQGFLKEFPTPLLGCLPQPKGWALHPPSQFSFCFLCPGTRTTPGSGQAGGHIPGKGKAVSARPGGGG